MADEKIIQLLASEIQATNIGFYDGAVLTPTQRAHRIAQVLEDNEIDLGDPTEEDYFKLNPDLAFNVVNRGPNDDKIGDEVEPAEEARRRVEGLPSLSDEAKVAVLVNPAPVGVAATAPLTMENAPSHLKDEAQHRIDEAERLRKEQQAEREAATGEPVTPTTGPTARRTATPPRSPGEPASGTTTEEGRL